MSFPVTLLRKRELVALFQSCCGCVCCVLVSFLHGAMGWYAVYDCGITGYNHAGFNIEIHKQFLVCLFTVARESAVYWKDHYCCFFQKDVLSVVMGATLGTGTFKPEKNLVFFSG